LYGPEPGPTAKPAKKNLPHVVEGLAQEKMRLENILNAVPKSSSVDSTASGQTSGWGTASHSRSSSISNIQNIKISEGDLQRALKDSDSANAYGNNEADLMEIS
jgi:hypothetical protein